MQPRWLGNVAECIDSYACTGECRTDVGASGGHASVPSRSIRSDGPFFPPRALVFKDLVVLKSLSVTVSLLLGWRPDSTTHLADTLPWGLVRLSIENSPQMSEDCQWKAEDVLQVLKEFVDRKKWMKFTPLLNSITVNDTVWSADKRQQEKSCEPVRVLVERNGLRYFASRVGIWDWEDDDDRTSS